jgi:Trypsin-like peptidase domain
VNKYIARPKFLNRRCSTAAARYIVAGTWLLLPWCNAADRDGAVPVKTIQQIERSIVPIICGYTDEQHRFQIVGIAGTGFFVDLLGRFLTAGHVLDDLPSFNVRHGCLSAIYIPDHGWRGFDGSINFQYFDFVNCVRDQVADLAVCEPIENPFTSKRIRRNNIASVVFDMRQWPEGTASAFTGFPFESVSPITSKGNLGGYLGIPERPADFDYIMDKAAWPGASGSPLYLRSGEVIGILLRAGINLGSGLTFGRSATVITDFLRQHPATRPEQQLQTNNQCP